MDKMLSSLLNKTICSTGLNLFKFNSPLSCNYSRYVKIEQLQKMQRMQKINLNC